MADQIYNNTINEFTDWVTGDNSLTNTNVTGSLKVSGEQVRKLLQKHLQKPIYMVKDEATAMYQIFSSQDAYDAYIESGKQWEDLLIGEFKGPSTYSMKITNLGESTLYVRKSEGNVCKLDYQWTCKDENDVEQETPVTITTTIQNSSTQKTLAQYTSIVGSGTTIASDDVYSYLESGSNLVQIKVESTLYSAVAILQVIVHVVDMSISLSNFKWWDSFKLSDPTATSLTVNMDIEYTSTEGASTLHILLDGNEEGSLTLQDKTTSYNLTISDSTDIPLQGRHRLVLYTEYMVGNTVMYSNVLLSLFTVAVLDVTNPNYDTLLINNYHSFGEGQTPQSILQQNYLLQYTQYDTMSLQWGIWYYTNTNLTMHIMLKYDDDPDNPIEIGTYTGVKIDTQQDNVTYTLTKAGSAILYYTLGANYTNYTQIAKIQVNLFPYTISEASGYIYKLSAQDKHNTDTSTEWTPSSNSTSSIKAQLYNIAFTDTSGWYENSLRMAGAKSYAEITNFPVDQTNGTYKFTFEIDFQSEYVADDEDVIVDILGCIKIYPNSASIMFSDGTKALTTNFKAGERTKIAFTRFGSDSSSGYYKELCTITTNGILERATSSVNASIALPNTGKVTFGKSNSGVRIYSFRYYRTPQTWQNSYDNWIFDSTNKAANIKNNDVWTSQGLNKILSYDKCSTKMEIINLIGGDLDTLLNSPNKVATTLESLERKSPTDANRNFVIKNCTIRTHGQSTISYPIKSYKIWSNKTLSGADSPEFVPSSGDTSWKNNMYRMKEGSIPANKWVLQANFADSSGTHNGAIQRLIHNTWYNATIDSEYKLRTPPQLFSTNKTITITQVPITDPDYADYQDAELIAQGYNTSKEQWGTYFPKTAFPYELRTSTDSFPCVIFYKKTSDAEATFLGQYVFMDDKKSDYIYGERSIYKVEDDPFCLQKIHANNSTKDNRIWNNKNVLRIEILSMDNDIVNYAKACPTDYQTNFDTGDYELIYPDPDDLDSADERNSTFRPFVDFHNWVVSTKGNSAKFQAEAYKHLDLYKMAAYYIYFLMFGMVDSVERNAQVKTYDGKHFWYEVWDADIACGNKNTGGINWDPGTDRKVVDVTDSSGKKQGAFSGYDSILWNQLEAWDTWKKEIVPKVAQALYNAGLTYKNAIAMFDDEYQNKWCEYIYDASGEYKYIESTSGNSSQSTYLPWLQGARNTHRHWWLSTSMDYWYSQWGAGSFREHNMYITTYNVATKDSPKIISIVAADKGSFAYGIQQGGLDTTSLQSASAGDTVTFDIQALSLSPKVPFYLYGVTVASEINLDCLASKLDGIDFSNLVNSDTGVNTSLQKLSLGVSEVDMTTEEKEKYDKKLSAVNNLSINLKEFNTLANLKELNITGQCPSKSNELPYSFPSTLQVLKAGGSRLQSLIASNNDFTTLELPNTYQEMDSEGNLTTPTSLQSLSLTNCTLPDEVIFYNTIRSNESIETFNENTGEDTEDTTTTTTTIHPGYLIKADTVNFTSLTMAGTTSQTENGKALFLKWLKSITIKDDKAYIGDTEITSRNVTISNIEWSGFTYDDAITIGKYLYNKTNPNFNGRITLAETESINADKLVELTDLFGSSVFILNSAGLVIDYPVDISIINVVGSGVSYNAEGKYYEVTENRIMALQLAYTRFKLSNEGEYTYRVQYGNTGMDVIESDGSTLAAKENVSLHATEDTILGTTTWSIQIAESPKSSAGEDYVLYVCESKDGTKPSQASTVAKIVVHPVVYPSAINPLVSTDSRLYADGVEMQTSSASCSFNLNGSENSATVKKVTWGILSGNSQLSSLNPSYFTASTFTEDNTNKTTKTETFLISLEQIPPNSMESFQVVASVSFYNDTVSYSLPLYLMYDPAVVKKSGNQNSLYSVLVNSGIPDTTGVLYLSDLLLCEELVFAEDTSFIQSSLYNTLLEVDGVKQNVFNYLTNLRTITVKSNAVVLFPSLLTSIQSTCTNLTSLDWEAGVLKGDSNNSSITIDFSNKSAILTTIKLPAVDSSVILSTVKINNSTSAVTLSLQGTISYLYITKDIANSITASSSDNALQVQNLYLDGITGSELGEKGKYAALIDPTFNKSLQYINFSNITSKDGNVGTQVGNWLYSQSNLNVIVTDSNTSFQNVTYMHFVFKNFASNANKVDFYNACNFSGYTIIDPDEYGDLIDHLELQKANGEISKLTRLTTLEDLQSSTWYGGGTSKLVFTSGAAASSITTLKITAHKSMTETTTVDLLTNDYIRDITSIEASDYNLNLELNNYSVAYLKSIKLGAPTIVNIKGLSTLETLSLSSTSSLQTLHIETTVSSTNNSIQYFLERVSNASFVGYLKNQSYNTSADLSSLLTSLSTQTKNSNLELYSCIIASQNTHMDSEAQTLLESKWTVSPYNCTLSLGSPVFKFEDSAASTYVANVYNAVQGTSKTGLTLEELKKLSLSNCYRDKDKGWATNIVYFPEGRFLDAQSESIPHIADSDTQPDLLTAPSLRGICLPGLTFGHGGATGTPSSNLLFTLFCKSFSVFKWNGSLFCKNSIIVVLSGTFYTEAEVGVSGLTVLRTSAVTIQDNGGAISSTYKISDSLCTGSDTITEAKTMWDKFKAAYDSGCKTTGTIITYFKNNGIIS